MRKSLAVIVSLTIASASYSQIKIAEGTQIVAPDGAIISIETNNDLEAGNTSSLDDDATIIIKLTGADQTISGNWVVDTLHILNGTFTRVEGTLTVSGMMNFDAGVLQPVDASSTSKSKIIFTGDGNKVLWQSGNVSYVDGTFSQIGEGERLFPVGSFENNMVSPLILQNVQTDNEVSVTLVAEDPELQRNVKLVQVDPTKYWIIDTDDLAALETRVGIPGEGLTLTDAESYVVVQADGPGEIAEDLGRSSDENGFATSDALVTKPIITLGTSTEVRLIIRDLITPSSMENNRMIVDNITAFSNNRVKLLDRWGTLVYEWDNYQNDNNDFDFSTLAPGNYICIVECWDEGSTPVKKSQMITVIKTR